MEEGLRFTIYQTFLKTFQIFQLYPDATDRPFFLQGITMNQIEKKKEWLNKGLIKQCYGDVLVDKERTIHMRFYQLTDLGKARLDMDKL
jgi:hypothetical protein